MNGSGWMDGCTEASALDFDRPDKEPRRLCGCGTAPPYDVCYRALVRFPAGCWAPWLRLAAAASCSLKGGCSSSSE